MTRIGFVGLGHMGLPMAINLVKAGFTVRGFDLQRKALDAFEQAGGIAVSHLQEAAIDNEIFITMLQKGEQVRDVCLGEHGLYEAALAHHGLHIDCSTIDQESALALHRGAAEKHLLSLDAPVSGGVAGAVAGSLTFLVGGRAYDLQKAEPCLRAMGSKIIHTGPGGSGQAAKICNNTILGISMIAVAEAFAFGKSLGLTAKKLHEVVVNASGNCWVMEKYVPVPEVLPSMPADNGYQPGFTVKMMLKDLLLSQEAAVSKQVFRPMAERATQLYQLLTEEGYEDLDFSAIYKLFEEDVKKQD